MANLNCVPELRHEAILQFFTYEHLPERLQVISKPFCELARSLCIPGGPNFVPKNAERSTALRKLLEGKDAAVRAVLHE